VAVRTESQAEASAPSLARLEVRSPFDGAAVGEVGLPSEAQIESALAAANAAAPRLAAMPAWERSEWLLATSARIGASIEELARTIAREAGKPIREARAEANRAMYVFRWAGEQAKRMEGSWLPLDTEPGIGRRAGIVRRFPIGPVLAITPFNFPLNLVAHKVAPALAVGNPVIVKPSTWTPLSALALADLVLEDDWPEGAITVLPMRGMEAGRLAGDERVRGISFTGSDVVGWKLKADHPRKKVTLELGGNGAVIIEPDADMDLAADRLNFGAFAFSGQVCISTQRILVHESVHDDFMSAFHPRVERLRAGDPLQEETTLAPLISHDALSRVSEWVDEAQAAGAQSVTDGNINGPFFAPTILEGVPHDARCWHEEVFGPVVCVEEYRELTNGIRLANGTRYGLQAAIFTRDLERALAAFEGIEAGGIIVNEAPFYRAVQQPYGGSRDSGYGREGVSAAMEEMTEPRILVLPLPPTTGDA
jgi:acyl-CoA reductase-like NAD-dependent aldehyde dehydrogenase